MESRRRKTTHLSDSDVRELAEKLEFVIATDKLLGEDRFVDLVFLLDEMMGKKVDNTKREMVEEILRMSQVERCGLVIYSKEIEDKYLAPEDKDTKK